VSGRVEAIFVADRAGAAMRAVGRCELVAGAGVAGDRYSAEAGTFSDWPEDHELTLIEAEAIEHACAEHGLEGLQGGFRRNIVTRGIALNEWVGREFFVGAAKCRGTRLCEPCAYLERLTGLGGLVKTLIDRGGLRAVVLEGAAVARGDRVAASEDIIR